MSACAAPAPGEVWVQDGGRTPRWLHFRDPVEVLSAATAADVTRCLQRVDEAAARGLAAAGWVAYEAAGAFEAAAATHALTGLPLAWFGVYAAWGTRTQPPVAQPSPVLEWIPSMTPTEYAAAVESVRAWRRAGDTYQVNLTFRLRAEGVTDALGLWTQLRQAHQPRHAALVATDTHVVCSASPELFFRLRGTELISRPMKGTSARQAGAGAAPRA